MAFKRSDWNNLIDSVNEVLQNPPADTDCNPKPTIDRVGPGTKWGKSHIKQVQDALKATCDSITFNPIPNLWKQAIVDEINTAIGQAWCNCQPDDPDDDCTPESAKSEDGMEFVLYDNGPPKVVSTCIGTDTDPIPLKDLINGVTFGQDQVFSRLWRVERRNFYNDHRDSAPTVIASGVLTCHGKVTYLGTQQVLTAAGIGVGCFDCFSDGCVEALADATSRLGNPDIFYNQYVLVINSTFAVCANPGDCP